MFGPDMEADGIHIVGPCFAIGHDLCLHAVHDQWAGRVIHVEDGRLSLFAAFMEMGKEQCLGLTVNFPWSCGNQDGPG